MQPLPQFNNTLFPLTRNFAINCFISQYYVRDYVTVMSLFLLTPFNLLTLEFISRERWPLAFLLPNPGLRAAPFALLLDHRGRDVSHEEGLVFRTRFGQRQRGSYLRLGSWGILIKYSGRALWSKLL